MLSASARFCLNRRDWLLSGSAATFGLASTRTARAAVPTNRAGTAKSVILIMLPGGPGQHDTFDPKPDAPAEIRGEFASIATAVPGIRFCEHLPQLAARASKFALVRSMAHLEPNHFPATHKILTGHKLPVQKAGDAENAQSRTDWPCYAAAYSAVRPSADGLPGGVALPHPLVGGSVVWPGQHAGFLGPTRDPWQLNKDPNAANFSDDTLSLPAGVSIGRVHDRHRLLGRIEDQQARLANSAEAGALYGRRTAAVNLLTSGRLTTAFHLDREPTSLRDRYGRHLFGQSLLLARRLVEAGVPIVQANMGAVQTWDTHADNFPRLKNDLLPQLDRAVSALLDDLADRGLLDETLIVMAGEFGRTPKIAKLPDAAYAGRNHWPQVYTAFFAGAGVRGGTVVGRSDAAGAYPTTRSYSPDDLGTTLFAALGLAADTEFRDPLGRPFQLGSGDVIEPLFRG